MKRPSIRSLGLVLAVLLVAGCGKSDTGFLVPNMRPTVDLSFAPAVQDSVSYSIRINWFGSDADGQVVGYEYAIDPPASPGPGIDTVWVHTTNSDLALFFPSTQPRRPLAPPGSLVPSSDYHTFVLRAVDNEGARSAPVARSFTSFTIAPMTTIQIPTPTQQLAVGTSPSLTITWSGVDTDGSQRPVKYKYKLAPATDISPNAPNSITAGRVQEYFEADAVNFFASWDSVGGDTTSKFYEGLTNNVRYYFAVVAFDEAGAYEPRFSLNSNVLQFRPTLDRLGPRVRVFNEFFSRQQSGTGVSTAESRIVNLEFPANTDLIFNWSATPPTGALITGYRWAVDIADITDNTRRVDDGDVTRWSTWSLNETFARIGPFSSSAESTSSHKFFVEARDNLGFVTLYTIRLIIVQPSFDRPLLVIDDLYGPPTNANPNVPNGVRIGGAFPMEAEQDTFYYARGGKPDSLYIRSGTPGVVSQPGVFADYAPDTLDYQFYPVEGIDLLTLSHYRLVCWYSDRSSATNIGDKFGGRGPMSAIRSVNTVNRLNTFGVYLRQGGNAWIFGEGMTQAIAYGFYSRFGGGPGVPYTSGDEGDEVLQPGNFLWDFCHIRSELNQTGTTSITPPQLQGCIPYLPEFVGPASQADRSKDPRIDPVQAARMAVKWSGLPRLTIASYRGANPDPSARGISETWVIKRPNFISFGPPAFIPAMDTLYLAQARIYDPMGAQGEGASDGFPNAVHYYGTENGPNSQLVWFGFPLHYFERSQVKVVVDKVMDIMNIDPASPSMRGAHPARVPGGIRVVGTGDTVDDRVVDSGRETR